MKGVTSFLTPLCLDSLPGPALLSPSRDCLTVQGRCFLLCTLSLQARCQLLLVAIPLPLLAVEGYGRWCWQATGSLPGQSCSLPVLLSKNKCLTWTPVPFHVLVPALSPSSQSRHSESGASPGTIEAAGSHGELRDGTAVNLFSSHLSILFGNGEIPRLPTVYSCLCLQFLCQP